MVPLMRARGESQRLELENEPLVQGQEGKGCDFRAEFRGLVFHDENLNVGPAAFELCGEL